MQESIAFVFPGQGSQSVGMGAELAARVPAARAVFDTADRVLGFSLSTVCFEGPNDQLLETINTQPAITAASIATVVALKLALGAKGTDIDAILAEPPLPNFAAGHSVGEYSALIAAGALSFADGMILVRERGRLMHREGIACPSGMAAVLGMDAAQLHPICVAAATDVQNLPAVAALRRHHAGAGSVVVANDNAPGQIVISGEHTALDRAALLAKEAGARRVIPLAVSGAFHSPVMAPASSDLAQAVAAASIQAARIPVISNSTARPIQTATEIREELVKQIASPVQWTQTIEWLVNEQGVTTFVELGAGQVLAGLIKRIAKSAHVLSAGTPDELVAVAAALRARGFSTE